MDVLEVKLDDNALLRGKDSNQLDPESLEKWFTFEISPQPAELEVQEQIKEIVSTVQVLLVCIQASGLIGNIFLSKALQDVWGVLNA